MDVPWNNLLPSALVVADLQRRLARLIEQQHIPGLSVALIRDGALDWSRGFGVKRAGADDPVTTETVFEAGSLSKPVFAYAVLRLCEAGALDLDTPLADYLAEPYLPDEPLLGRITARHVLAHTSGFPNWRPEGDSLRIRFEPGTRFSYSGAAYVYLQNVVERIIGEPLAEHARRTIFEPFEMSHSSFVWTAEEQARGADGHSKIGNPREKRYEDIANAAYSLHTTAEDFARFVIKLLSSSASDTGPHTLDDMLQPQVAVNDLAPWHKDWPTGAVETREDVFWGLGWGLQRAGKQESFWHWGDNGDFTSFAVASREFRTGVVLMSNSPNGRLIWRDATRCAVGGEHPALDWLDRVYEE